MIYVAYKTTINALGVKKTGWVILERGQICGFYGEDKDKATRNAHAIASFRVVGGVVPQVRVIDEVLA